MQQRQTERELKFAIVNSNSKHRDINIRKLKFKDWNLAHPECNTFILMNYPLFIDGAV